MVAIEHRQKSAIIATDTDTETDTDRATTTATLTTTTISSSTSASSSSSSDAITTTDTLATSTPTRRSSDIVNSNDIAVLSPTLSTNSSSTITVITTTTTKATTTNSTTSNIIYVTPKDNINDKQVEEKVEEEAEAEAEEEGLERELQIEVEAEIEPQLDKSPAKMSQSSSEASTATAESAAVANKQAQTKQETEPTASRSAVSQRNVDIKIANKSNKDANTKELAKKVLKLDLTGKELDQFSIKSPKSPIPTRLPHQSSLTTVDVEDRKTLREALYQGIFHRHRRTIFAVGSFLRMLRSRNSSYNTIRSSSEGEDVDETR